jgi:hypothetical protein
LLSSSNTSFAFGLALLLLFLILLQVFESFIDDPFIIILNLVHLVTNEFIRHRYRFLRISNIGSFPAACRFANLADIC